MLCARKHKVRHLRISNVKVIISNFLVLNTNYWITTWSFYHSHTFFGNKTPSPLLLATIVEPWLLIKIKGFDFGQWVKSIGKPNAQLGCLVQKNIVILGSWSVYLFILNLFKYIYIYFIMMYSLSSYYKHTVYRQKNRQNRNSTNTFVTSSLAFWSICVQKPIVCGLT